MNAPVLPGPLKDNPSLARWVAFPAPGQVAINTGRVEIGQGVLTAMVQIAADELDVSMQRITIRSGNTEVTPNEGYTAGSQSIQFGGVAMGSLRRRARCFSSRRPRCWLRERAVHSRRQSRERRGDRPGLLTLAGAVDLKANATGSGARKPVTEFKSIGQSSARLDLPGKIFGDATFIHDMRLDGMLHARVVRQPNRGASIGSIDERAILRAAKAPVQFVRQENFVAILGDDETAVDLAAIAADTHVKWQNVETPTAIQQEANWLLQRPAVDRVFGAPDQGNPQGRQRFEATYTRGYLAHASISPSCGLARYENGHLTVWTHCQGVFAAGGAGEDARAEASAITVHHVQGPAVIHNGADDVAADAAIIAMQMPGKPPACAGGEEEFIYGRRRRR